MSAVKRPDFYELIARERGCPEGWTYVTLKAVGEGRAKGAALVKGAIYPTKYKSGPRRGETNYSKPLAGTERELLITFAELDTREVRWEQETGVCSKCEGTGQMVSGFHERKPCTRCHATGEATLQTKEPTNG